jgi:hypothetical protein
MLFLVSVLTVTISTLAVGRTSVVGPKKLRDSRGSVVPGQWRAQIATTFSG